MSQQGWFKVVFILFAVLAVLPTANVQAIGITPGRATINFEPGLEKDISFTVINNEHKEMIVSLYIKTEKNIMITLDESTAKFLESDESKTFRYKIKLPDKIDEPGAHTVEIIAVGVPKDMATSGAFVGATTAVVHQLKILVPYPGKYATAELNIKEAGKGEPVEFFVRVSNVGKADILKANADIEIRGPTNEKIASVKTNEISINTGERGEVSASWKADVNPGIYSAKATIYYDGEVTTVEKTFAVGNLAIELSDIQVNDFVLGGIAKFNVFIESKWNEKISGVYAQMVINDEKGNVMVDIKSASIDVEPMGKAALSVYWDTSGVTEGTYDSVLRLNYADRTAENKLKTYVRKNSIKTEIIGVTAKAISPEAGEGAESQINTLIYIVIVLVVINLIWLYRSKRKRK